MKLYASEDEAYQIRTGREIVAAYPEIYKPWVIEDIRQNLQQHADIRPDIAGGRSLEDIFAIATYDYWQYGIGPTEEFYNELLGLAERLPTLRYIGWDFVYDKDKEWIVMEGNENAEILSQFVYHRGEREEFEQFIGYKPIKKYWWQGKYPSRFK